MLDWADLGRVLVVRSVDEVDSKQGFARLGSRASVLFGIGSEGPPL